MPLFEFACPRCGEKTEVLVRAGVERTAPTCAQCGVPMEKQWAPVAVGAKGDAGCGAPRGGFR